MGCNGIVELLPSETYPREKACLPRVQNLPRILLADDQQEILRAVSSLIENEYQIAGMAEDGKSVLDLVRLKSPDLVVLDIFMPMLNGFETATRLKESGSAIKMLFLTVHEDPDFLDAAFSVGGLGYVLKPHLVTDLLPAIREVLNGNLYISPSLLSVSLDFP